MKKLISAFIAIFLIMLNLPHLVFANEVNSDDIHQFPFDTEDTLIDTGKFSYQDLLEEYSKKSLQPSNGKALIATKEGDNAFTVNSDIVGRYYVKVDFSTDITQTDDLQFSLEVNDLVQYEELNKVLLRRRYTQSEETLQDIYENDIRPSINQINISHESYLFDYSRKHTEPLSVFLDKGENTFDIKFLNGFADITRLVLEPSDGILSYEQTKNSYQNQGLATYDGALISHEAERVDFQTVSSIFPISDKTSPETTPYNSSKIRLNTIGGNQWKTSGEAISWKINVPQEGLYKISFRVRQNLSVGSASTRNIFINGKIPFTEAMNLRFKYSSKWQIDTIGGEEEDYLFHLKSGDNLITLQASLGELDETYRELESVVQALNVIYRRFLLIMGATPDLLRDYRLSTLVPDAIGGLKLESERLSKIQTQLERVLGKGNSGVAQISTLIRQLNKMNEYPDKIPNEYSYFKTNIGALSSWLTESKNQPLELDRIFVGNNKDELPKANAGFFKQLIHNIKQYLSSYFIDYQSIGQREEGSAGEKPLKVWVSTGREQAQIVRNLAVDSFTPKYNSVVDLKLVTTSLLPATAAGVGPDAVILSSPDVINFAMRSAAHALSDYHDSEEVLGRFEPSLLIKMRYRDKIYGLPETISFPVLFYRKDILNELKLSVPKTWDELISISSTLSKNNMEIGVESNENNFLMLLKQHGLDIYANDGEYTLLDTSEAIKVFTFYTNLYANYGLPLSFDFFNRFRTGEMPLGVMGFGLYNQLQLAAPEISDLWGIAPVPGIVSENGEINNTSLADTQGSMVLESSQNKALAWEFLSWWTSEETQVAYAKEIEAVLGVSGRYYSANNAAFAKLNWNTNFGEVLNTQKQRLTAIENVPGGYFLSRNLNNAFRSVVYSKNLPTDVIYDYSYKINSELTAKRKEFGLSVREQK